MSFTYKFEQFFVDFTAASEADDDDKMDELEKLERSLLSTATIEELYEHAVRETSHVTGVVSLDQIDAIATELAKCDDLEIKTAVITKDKLAFNGLVFDKYSKLLVAMISSSRPN